MWTLETRQLRTVCDKLLFDFYELLICHFKEKRKTENTYSRTLLFTKAIVKKWNKK